MRTPLLAAAKPLRVQALKSPAPLLAGRFSAASALNASNRVYNSIRHPSEFDSILLLSSSSNQPLITLWTASWCSICKTVSPLIKDLIESTGVGTKDGKSVGFAEVEIDSPTIGDVPGRYMLSSIPTLLSFSRGEPQLDTRVTSPEKLKDRAFMIEWIEREAARGGAGGAGGSLLGGLFKGS